MKNYKLKDCVFAFYIIKDVVNIHAHIREILANGKIENNDGIHLITPIAKCLKCVTQKNCFPQIHNELWGIGVRISKLDSELISYDVQDCRDCPDCKILLISNNSIDISSFDRYDIIVLCPKDDDRKNYYREKKINGKNWPCWHRLSLSCKYVSYYEKSDKGIDEYLKHKFNTKNYHDEEIDETVNNVLF